MEDALVGRAAQLARILEDVDAGGMEAGLLLRFTADTIAVAPRFIGSEEETVKMAESLRTVLRHIA